MRVVIADDLKPPRLYACQILTALGAKVTTCENGQQAVDECAREHADIVILDIVMPVMNGQQAAEIIHRDGTARHIVVASSQGQDGVVSSLKRLGARFMLKPYKPAQLTALIALIREADGLT